MATHTDQLGRTINLPSVPKRIISIVPSQTELLFYLGLNEEVVGITKFCIHPENKFKATSKVGGTKQFDFDKIRSLQPDLIIANKEENDRVQVEALMDMCPVWISDVYNLESAVDMIDSVGELTGRSPVANQLSKKIKISFNNLKIPKSQLTVAYLIWREPFMVAGKNTFIDAMLSKCGLTNVFKEDRYPEVNVEMLVKPNPDVVLLSSEPYPFKEKHIAEIKRKLPSAIVKLVDGESFSWYGSRLLYAPAYFKKLSEEITCAKSENC